MKRSFWKKLMLLIPIVVLAATLLFIDYAVRYYKETVYQFVRETNAGSMQRFSQGIQSLGSVDFDVIQTFNQTLGGKYAVITFMLDQDDRVFHSNDGNEAYLSERLGGEALLREAAEAWDAGQIEAGGGGTAWLYRDMQGRDGSYRLFMYLDREMLYTTLRANAIILPISLIGLFLLLLIEDSIWLRAVERRKGEKA